jgi:hypothetical protein
MNLSDYPAEFWHCSVSINRKDRDLKEKVVNDLTFEELYNQIIAPWHQQRRFSISGLVVDREQIEEIRIAYTPHPMSHYAEEMLDRGAEMAKAGFFVPSLILGRYDEYAPFSSGKDYTNELLFQNLKVSPPSADTQLILTLCQRIPYTARILATRSRKGKAAYTIEDEYDVQDLLHGLIRAYMKYSIQEESLGKIAGSSSRADIAVEDLGILVEVKYVHGPNDQVRIFKELSSDQELYVKWEPLKALICLIYNSGDLRDPESMEKLSGTRIIRGKQFEMYVVLA